MRVISFLLLVLSSYSSFSTELKLVSTGDDLYELKIINKSNMKANIAGQVCLSILGSFSFIIKDELGQEHFLAVKLNEKCNNDLIVLEPYRFIGRIFHNEELKHYYNLKPGVYKINALMCDLLNESESNKNCLSSNLITLNIK